MEHLDLHWIYDLDNVSKGKVGEIIAESYLINNLPNNPASFSSDFQDIEVSASRQTFGPETFCINEIDSAGRTEQVRWDPDLHISVSEKLSSDEFERRSEETIGVPDTITKNIYVEVKTSKNEISPIRVIGENQQRVMEFLAKSESDIPLCVTITVGGRGFLLDIYKIDDNRNWKEISLQSA